jgi:hypothetical protein
MLVANRTREGDRVRLSGWLSVWSLVCGGFCCLFVVSAAALAVLLVRRGRRGDVA